MRRQLTLAVLAVLLAAPVAFAGEPSNTPEIGPRQIGMGGAFVGLADDAYAIFYNPAGLPRLQRQEFTGSYMPSRLISGQMTGYGAGTWPIGDRQAIGADVCYEQYNDDLAASALDWAPLTVRASYGVALHRTVSIGVTAKYLSNTPKWVDTQQDEMTGFGFDAGILVDFGGFTESLDGLRLGLHARDIGGTSVTHDTETSEEILPELYTVGASYKILDNLTVLTDVTFNDRIHFGTEYTLLNMLSLRAGLARDIYKDGGDLLFSGGIGLHWKGISFDYAYQHHPVLNASHHFGLSFVYNPSYITIKDANVRPTPLFRALYRHYETDPLFASITLKNTSQEPVPVSVGIRVPTMMPEGAIHSQEYVIPPQSTETVDLGVTIDDSLLIRESSNYDNLIQPEVVVSYLQDTEEKQAARNLQSVYVLGRNKMTWEDPRRICAFVTPEHSSVIGFGDWAIRQFRSTREEVFSRCQNMGTAMVIFDALGKYGISYNPDQTTPFYRIASDTTNMRTIFDTIKFPVDMLRSRLGDCDDCTILMVSLLEQQNIRTALLDVFDPVWGHVYMMFDSGLTPEEALASGLFLSENDFVVWTDPAEETGAAHAWIPIETTMYGQTFTDAWQSGVQEYRERKARNYIREWSVTEGRQLFQAGVVDTMTVTYPDVNEVRDLITLDVTRYQERLALPALPADADADTWYERGVQLVGRSQYARAIEAFTRVIELNPDFSDAYNGRGVARNHEGGRVRYLTDDPARRREEAEGQWRAAVEDFRAALGMRSEPGYWVNLMISYQLLNSTEEARQARQQALEMDEGLAPILDGLLEFAE